MNTQKAPYPFELDSLVSTLTYKPGWHFSLGYIDRGQGSAGQTLVIRVIGPDTNDFSHRINVLHYMPVPPAAYNRQSWQRWLLEQILLVERHEACEFFRIDWEQPFAPNHSEGYDPYQIRELTTEEERNKTFREK